MKGPPWSSVKITRPHVSGIFPRHRLFRFLDKSRQYPVIHISAPAGSGKTEKLARRYIALLKSGVDVERILAVTFTDKAAAEMKQRILKILKEEDEELFKKLLEKMSLMRVITIHSFCGTLLRRFSFEASIDPNYRIEDAIDSRIIWEEILYEILMEAGEGKDGHDLLLRSLGEKGFRGLEYLKTTVNNLFEKSPFSLDAEPADPSLPPSCPPLVRERWGGNRGQEGGKEGMGGLIEELRNWPGAEEAIEDYEKYFEGGSFERLILLEKYFLTAGKELRKRPAGSLKHIADYPDWAARMYLYWKYKNIEEFTKRADTIREIFKKCFGKYSAKKALKGILDFSDLEYMAYRLLTENPEWANILYAFDEKTDHILVDEFQDTNSFQWAIIDKLTEEWRSGLGAKREGSVTPTIFLVGDEKQSIYFFRGANVEIFKKAKEKLEDWLKDEFCYEEVRENFRSRPAIIDFTNCVFPKILTADENAPSWITRYSPFEACRKDSENKGSVEIILLNDDTGSIAESKQKEADVIAKRIQSLVGNLQITDRRKNTEHRTQSTDKNNGPIKQTRTTGTDNSQRYCRYMDVALLLRKRTHLKKYEEAFRKHDIPFVVVKGIGFYLEPEVAILRSLVYFLSNPHDDYSLYILLKSPFFSMSENVIIKAMGCEGDSLFSKLQKIYSENPPIPPLPPSYPPLVRGGWGGKGGFENAVKVIEEWLSQLSYAPIAELIEKALVQTKAWEYFYEAQRRANVKKFIRLVEDLERDGKSLIKIRDFLERTRGSDDEPKANVNTEGMDAVRIMTIHASKGLEFPIVFMPGIEEKFSLKTNDSLIYESDGKHYFKYQPQSAIRKQDEDFMLHLQKEEEEQKRLFYVAVTRAEEALFLAGQWSEDNRGFLGFLEHGLGLQKIEDRACLPDRQAQSTEHRQQWEVAEQIQGLSVLSEQDVDKLYKKISKPKHREELQSVPAAIIPLEIKEAPQWKAVTEVVNIRRRHGKNWVILGDIIHRLFEGISKGTVSEQDMRVKAGKLLTSKGIIKEDHERLFSIIENDISLLKERGIWQDVIMPGKNSFSELPFTLEYEDVVYTGRIDRVIKEDGAYNIYDYKTFPVNEKEIGYLLKEYSFQLGIYEKAVKMLFNAEAVRSFIIFTHAGEIRENI